MTCGFAVEWVRTCFRSRWRLFRDQPEVLTDGRLVRLPEGNRNCCPFPTFFGSRDWVSDERDPLPALGEWEGSRQYDTGRFDDVYPSYLLLGDKESLFRGAVYPPPAGRTFIAGFDARCWVAEAERARATQFFPLNDRAFQLEMAEVQVLLYSDPPAAVTRLQAFLGPDYTISVTANDPLSDIPGSIVAVSPAQSVVIVSGTTTFQQLALQFAQGTVPEDMGQFSCLLLHWQASLVVTDRMTAAGVNADRPILLVGHSYGGAVAQVVAARIGMNHDRPPVQLLTYAAPYALDRRGLALTANMGQVHLVNTGDPVPCIPPRPGDFWVVDAIVPPLLRSIWDMLDESPHRWVLADDGTCIETPNSSITLAELYFFTRLLVLVIFIPVILPHSVAAYRDRLLLTPPPP